MSLRQATASVTLPLAHRKAIDVECDRFEAEWRSGGRPDLAAFLGGVAGEARDGLFRELLALDLDYRLAAGDAPGPSSYREQFPEHASAVESAFAVFPGTRIGADFPGKPGSRRESVGLKIIDEHASGGVSEALRVAGYEVIAELGRGGMGIVFKARQAALKREVALKVIRSADSASRDELRRFRHEAEAVARLDHPNIVPIFEVGRSLGHDFFSMKLIPGQSLDKTLGDRDGDPRAVAALVRVVAEAVHHAHMRGILHRDLKPANILIDEGGHPHVTDFGLAHRLDGDGGLTRPGVLVGTPAYMSPEQASGLKESLTTASDVYGLGAVLYALLTGRAPLTGSSLHETLDLVRSVPPEPPSRRNPRVPRDLDVICLKCLEKDPERRYPDARGLAEDLDRWLSGRPIAARPVNAVTRARLWCRRHPLPAALATSLAASIIVGFALVSWKWREADFKERKASKVVAYLSDHVLRQASTEFTPRSSNPSLREVLDRTSARVGGDFQDEPEVEAAIREALGSSYASLGEAGRAEPHLREALRLNASLLGSDHPTTLRVGNELAAMLDSAGRPAEAESLLRETLERGRRALGDAAPATLDAAERLGSLLRRLGRPDEAGPLLRTTLATRRRVLPTDDPKTLRSVREVGLLAADRGDFAEAEARADEYEHGIRRAFGPKHPDNVAALSYRGLVRLRGGRPAEAEPFYRRAAEEARRILGPDHPATRSARADHARVLDEIDPGILGKSGGSP